MIGYLENAVGKGLCVISKLHIGKTKSGLRKTTFLVNDTQVSLNINESDTQRLMSLFAKQVPS